MMEEAQDRRHLFWLKIEWRSASLRTYYFIQIQSYSQNLDFEYATRDYIISKSMCLCGATYVMANDQLPNMTLTDTINRILKSNMNSGENG
ncbi:E3 ubiquitin ligase PARAQUAT TOLERANCE 3-like isoform X2 [Amborella trichopoda]|nr:E3 ubiquitin ligase PARAQUAT TOLERANCE 3-like isoform X2 [Amborella trichopoda]|eukprot:XP_020532154.1 E3 ubiquitin ligase PARAQUAT TOLERANCE 3-like isoform X2 [Amborella trichopoda]